VCVGSESYAKLMGNSPTIAARQYINLVHEEMGDEVAF